MMAVQALITEGNISLAVNNANSMYQQAKAIDYPSERHWHCVPLQTPTKVREIPSLL